VRLHTPRYTMKYLTRLRTLHPNKMLRAAKNEQGLYALIVELDMIGGKTDKLLLAEI